MIEPVKFHAIVECDESGYRGGKLAAFARRLKSTKTPVFIHVLCHDMGQRSVEAIQADPDYASTAINRGLNPLSASRLIVQVTEKTGHNDLVFVSDLNTKFQDDFFPTLAKIAAAQPKQTIFRIDLAPRISNRSQTLDISGYPTAADTKPSFTVVRSPLCRDSKYPAALKALPTDFLGDLLYPCLAIAPTSLYISGLQVSGPVPVPHRNTPWMCRLLIAAIEAPDQSMSLGLLASLLSGAKHVLSGRLSLRDWFRTFGLASEVATL